MQNRSYKVIVVGAYGLVGSSALYQAAKKLKDESSQALFNKPRVLGLDQFLEGHELGSSKGPSRITRVAIGEGDEYVALAKRSHEIWQEVEAETKEEFGKLLHVRDTNGIGGLIVGPKGASSDVSYHGSKGGFLQQTELVAKKNEIAHQHFSRDQLGEIFPQFKFRENDEGYSEETMGFIRPDACVLSNVRLAKEYGAEVKERVKVIKFERLANGKIAVTTERDNQTVIYETEKLIIAAGPWITNLLGKEATKELKVYRQTVFHFQVEVAYRHYFRPDKFPTFIWNLDSKNIVYGFPMINGGSAIKLGTENYLNPTSPEEVNRNVSEEEIKHFYETRVKPYFTGVTDRCADATVCLYTVAPNWRFVVDFLPEYGKDVIVASPCSGHGAKHAAAMGEALVEQVLLGQSKIPVVELFGGMFSSKKEEIKVSDSTCCRIM